MTFYIDRCDRNGHITSNIFHYYAIKSSLTKVMGLQSPFFLAHFGENERRSTIFRHHKHASTDVNYIQHNCSDNISQVIIFGSVVIGFGVRPFFFQRLWSVSTGLAPGPSASRQWSRGSRAGETTLYPDPVIPLARLSQAGRGLVGIFVLLICATIL